MITDIKQLGVYERKLPTTRSNLRTCTRFEVEFFLSTSDNACSFLNGKKIELSTGTLIFRKPEQTSQSLPYFKCYYIHFNLEKSDPHYEELMQLPDYYTLINEQTYRDIFEKVLHHTIKNSENLQDDFTQGKLLELFYHLKKDAQLNQTEYNINRQNQKRLQKTLTYIKEHFYEDLTLKSLGTFAGYTPNYFERLFIETMNVTPQKYIEQLRIEHAKYLLAKADLSIAEVAYTCGFSSQSYFALIFKKHTLITPFEFRKLSAFRNDSAYLENSTNEVPPPLEKQR